MSDHENFLRRWSRRKLTSPDPSAPAEPTQRQHAEDAATASAPAQHAAAGQDETKLLDPAALPSIESIGADSDVTPFLRPGVPLDLTRAALRKAWTSDPAIRDFVGLVENGWDFNNPDAMDGFGTISTAEVARLASHLLAQLPELTDHRAATQSGPDGEKVSLPHQACAPTSASEAPAGPAEQSDNNDTNKNDALQKNSDG